MARSKFHLTAAAVALALMGVYLLPPPAEFEPDEPTMAVDQLLESELENWLERLNPRRQKTRSWRRNFTLQRGKLPDPGGAPSRRLFP
jgi:hypothetical protein